MRYYTVRPSHPLTLEARVAKIEPQGTSVTIIAPDIKAKEVASDEIFEAEGAAGLRVVASSTARVVVTYADEVE